MTPPAKMEKVSFNRLPTKTKEAVEEIIKHRNMYNRNSLIFIPIYAIIFAIQPTWWGKMIAAGMLGTMGAAHLPGFKIEYLNLFRAIGLDRNKARIKKLLKQPNANYIIVNSRGDLVPVNKNPLILKHPIGRRRVPNPINKDVTQKWRRMISKRK